MWFIANDVEQIGLPRPADAGDIRNAVSIPESGRYPGGGHGNPLQPGRSHGQRSLASHNP